MSVPVLPDWLRCSSGFRTWDTRTDGSSLPSSDCLRLDWTRWTATVALRAETRWDGFESLWWMHNTCFSSFFFGRALLWSQPVRFGVLPDVQGVRGSLSRSACSNGGWCPDFRCCNNLPRDCAFIFCRLALKWVITTSNVVVSKIHLKKYTNASFSIITSGNDTLNCHLHHCNLPLNHPPH